MKIPLIQRTSCTAKDLINHGCMLKKSIRRNGLDNGLITPILQFIKGSVAAAYQLCQITEELLNNNKTQIDKARRKSQPNTVAHKGGWVELEGIRHMRIERDENNREKAERAINLALRQLAKLDTDARKQLQKIRQEAWKTWYRENEAHRYFQNVQRKRWLRIHKGRK